MLQHESFQFENVRASKDPGTKSIIKLGTQSPQPSNYIHTDNDHYQIRTISPIPHKEILHMEGRDGNNDGGCNICHTGED
jgi:hypothetical protein